MPMKKLTSTDPDTRSADPVVENVERLKALFPELVTEGPNGVAINVDVLKALVGDKTLTDCDEKYGLNWHGKRRARQLALTSSTGTLRPAPDDSVDWDTTQNLIIEGDNLEVLKLLQKSYAGKVKLIYIDPPYNTGKDFIYPDTFQDSIRNYLELTGQVEGGAQISSNTEAGGRFHTEWLNMMYPRLRISRYLLRQDGIILISIGETEASRLQQLLAEVFGEENCLGSFVWTYRHSENQGTISAAHEYVLAAVRDAAAFGRFRLTRDDLDRLGAEVSDACFRGTQAKNPVSALRVPAGVRCARGGDFEIPRGTLDFGVAQLRFEEEAVFRGGVLAKPITLSAAWTMKDQCEKWFAAFEAQDAEALVQDSKGQRLIEIFFESSGRLSYRKERSEQSKVSSHLHGEEMTYVRGRVAVEGLFDGVCPFPYPKPPALIRRLVELSTQGTDLVCDFFAGSGTTGQAVLEANRCDSGNRRLLLVQLPEPLEGQASDARAWCDKLGKPRNIAELTKERLRRAAKKIKGENPMFTGDLGFRVFKLDSSNIREWEPDRDDLDNTVLNSVEHLKEGRTEADVLYELLLKLGLDLCVPIETRTIAGKEVHEVGGGVLMVSLTETISRDDVEALAMGIVDWHTALAPAGDTTCVFRDSAFADDVAKTNLAAILEQHGIENMRSL